MNAAATSVRVIGSGAAWLLALALHGGEFMAGR